MNQDNSISEDLYKVDFEISKSYIDFSSELLRISLTAMGAIGSLLLLTLEKETILEINYPTILAAMTFFALSSGASLFHRFFASDFLSWYISYLREVNKGNIQRAEKEKIGYSKSLRNSRWALIINEFLFGFGVLFFIVAVFFSIYPTLWE